jgi:integrase/recombinase XerD
LSAIFLLSVKAGLRAKEIAALRWTMVADPEGNIGETIELQDIASKANGGRTIPLHKELRAALVTLKEHEAAQRAKKGFPLDIADHVITSERGEHLSPNSVAHWFKRLFGPAGLGFDGCSSHSGRRTFITKAARKVSEAGGSLRDVQQLAGHASLGTTQRYVEGDSEAKRNLWT